MGRGNSSSLKRHLAFCILSSVVEKVNSCIDMMRQDCENNRSLIDNNEVAIRDYLFVNCYCQEKFPTFSGKNSPPCNSI